MSFTNSPNFDERRFTSGQKSLELSSQFYKNLVNLYAIEREMSQRSSNNSFQTTNRYEKKQRVCGFCKTNGELESIFSSHYTKDKTGKTICPILRKHVCEICSATGDTAHTRSHCPNAQQLRTDPFMGQLFGESYLHNTVAVKKTKLNSAGRVRKN